MNKREKAMTTSFDGLADDLKLDILGRLAIKDRGKLRCVSKQWRHLINASSPRPIFTCLLYRSENKPKPTAEIYNMHYYPSCSHKVVTSSPMPKALQESCNGLILLCCSHKRIVDQPRRKIHCYAVFNPLTKQYVPIAKPKPYSSSYKYAALAYDPAESSYFKIIRFRVKHLDIYSSKTGNWTSLRFQLGSNDAIRAKWRKQSLYLNGSIYRLSMSGHVLRFDINNNETATKKPLVVEEIEIPVGSDKVNETACIGLSKGHVNFAMRDGSSLKIWELNQAWSLKLSCSLQEISPSSSVFARPFAFHPYSDAIFVGFEVYPLMHLSCLHYSDIEKRITAQSLLCSHSQWAKDQRLASPFFLCDAAFSCHTSKRYYR